MSIDSFDEEDFEDTDERLPYSHRTYDDRDVDQTPEYSQDPLSQSPKASPRRASELADRLNFLQQLAENRTNLQRQELQHKEMQQCTFRPEINDSSPKRTFNQFMESQKRFEARKHTKLEQMRERKKEEEEEVEQQSLSRVELSEGSKAILSQKSCRPVYERLYSPPARLPPAMESPHHPSVSPRSKLLQRTERVDVILYTDAVRRMTKPALTPSPSHRALVNQKSEEMLAEVIIREVEATWATLDLPAKASYVDLGKLLADMKFLTGSERELLEDAWTVLRGQELGYVCKQTIVNFLFALNNIHAPGKSVEATEDEDVTIVSPQDCRGIRSKFASFIENKKRAHLKQKSSPQESAFKPTLSPGSRRVTESAKQAKRKPEDLSLRPPAPHKPPNLPKTPSPTIRAEGEPQKFSDIASQQRDSSESSGSKAGKQKPAMLPKGWEKSVERMKSALSKANKMQARAELRKRKAVTPQGRDSEKRFFEPESTKTGGSEPVILVNVTLPSGEVATFTLFRQDEYVARVKEFTERNGLSEEDSQKLLETLQEHVNKT